MTSRSARRSMWKINVRPDCLPNKAWRDVVSWSMDYGVLPPMWIDDVRFSVPASHLSRPSRARLVQGNVTIMVACGWAAGRHRTRRALGGRGAGGGRVSAGTLALAIEMPSSASRREGRAGSMARAGHR